MKALILVDIQTDFLPGGALAVPNGDAIIPIANRLQAVFPLVVATQDWHPANHGSFAANHPGKNLFEQIDLNGLPQTLWPVHCVQKTPGAELAPGLEQERIAKIFPKGTDAGIDSYSGLFDNGHRKSTGLSRTGVRFHARKSALRQKLEKGFGANGRQGVHARPTFQGHAQRRGTFPRHPF